MSIKKIVCRNKKLIHYNNLQIITYDYDIILYEA